MPEAAAHLDGTPFALPGALTSCASPAYPGTVPPALSVVVPTFGRVRNWPELISALESQTLSVEHFEVVVVDDCSPDETWQLLVETATRTPLRLVAVRLSENVGSGAARTRALAWCRAAVVAFTDDDCLPSAQWLERLEEPFARRRLDRGSGLVVQGRTIPRPEEIDAGGPWGRTLWVLRPTWLFETCNIAYRKADLEAAGGFPSRGSTPAVPSGRQVGEDALAGWRVVEQGAELVFVADAVVYHRVVPENYWSWLGDHRGRAVFPALAAISPLARRAFWGRWFLSSRSAAMVLAVVATLGARVWRRPGLAVAGVLPWVLLALPEAGARGGRHPALRLSQLAMGDLVGLWATAWASVRNRALVL